MPWHSDQVRRQPRCLRVVLTLVCAVLSACSLQVEESDVAGVYVAHFKSGSEKLQLQRDGSFVQQVLVQGVETRNFGTWTYERTDGVVAVIHLTDCLAVSDGFGDIRADFATQRGGCRFPLERRWFIFGQVRLGPEMPSALRKIELSRAERRDLQALTPRFPIARSSGTIKASSTQRDGPRAAGTSTPPSIRRS